MKSKNLLTQITDLESALNNFSFEELTTEEASRLKRSFDTFKHELEARIWGITPEQPETDEEQEKNRESHLIAKVSHEVRTPLNGIMGFADLLKEGDLNPAQQQQVDAILSASRSLLDIINELLEYSKLEAGSEEFKEVSFNFHNLIREVSYLCETLIVDKKITLEVTTDPEIPPFLLGDPSKLTQVLLNLLGNAIKFSDRGKVVLETRLDRIERGKAHLKFRITDTGIGIPGEDLNHIFDAFRQAGQHTFSKYGGAGLGLSIVKQIVDRLGGTISVQSEVNKGTRFDMTLIYEVGQEEKVLKEDRNKTPEKDLRSLNVLVFEDNPLNQWLIKKRLRNWGCSFFVTEHAVEGLKILEEEQVHLVFMDLHMPVVDGYEITRRIRASENPRISGVPVIALTADFSVHDREKAAADGINDFILKPYTPQELLDKLMEYGFPDSRKSASTPNPNKPESPGPTPEPNFQIDLTGMLEDCMGEVDMLEELISLFKGNVLEFTGRAKLHLKNQDTEQLRFAAHKMKSGLAMVQAENLLILVRQIQDHCQNDPNYERMQYLFDRFVQEYPMVECTLDRELMRLKKEN
ncbi:Signal transduction histidine kinase [Muriicola jejuensis]|uniref:histidine kinase n=1 Tax=Muriicola jejuensis TaxID=504488 RepID=A0A6P0UHG8_9FLAO|nr:ATP-binding protein [Muriicola jejuensis]NER11258.1 response regulator [Muriicola jejuensis]SMP21832.1 Signal transduction histidine kinase [Muriicola jejuensis]